VGICSFPKTSRLLNANDYQSVFSHSRYKVSCRHFLILAKPNEGPNSRLGLIVAKKNVSKAVQRNRIKRQIREWFRHLQLQNSLDLIVLVRRDTDRLLNSQIAQKLETLGCDLDSKSNQQRGQPI
jgi:ribonuclease P protein component